MREGLDVTLVSYGILINEVLAAAEILKENGISAEVIKLNCISPLDCEKIKNSAEKTGCIVVAEESCENGGVGSRVLSEIAKCGIPLRSAKLLNLGGGIVPQGEIFEQRWLCGIDAAGIADSVTEVVGKI